MAILWLRWRTPCIHLTTKYLQTSNGRLLCKITLYGEVCHRQVPLRESHRNRTSHVAKVRAVLCCWTYRFSRHKLCWICIERVSTKSTRCPCCQSLDTTAPDTCSAAPEGVDSQFPCQVDTHVELARRTYLKILWFDRYTYLRTGYYLTTKSNGRHYAEHTGTKRIHLGCHLVQ